MQNNTLFEVFEDTYLAEVILNLQQLQAALEQHEAVGECGTHPQYSEQDFDHSKIQWLMNLAYQVTAAKTAA